jgi:rhamnose utilization protein RhaD (predicted bifunctional aldolase and dehydrogenase)/NAD(P)-dependent dehydrogenase (short-subunit alcohol dehydrogenase family)
MKSNWKDTEAKDCQGDLLKLRVYTSRLLGKSQDLVMHGGGNTSVKVKESNLFGEEEDILYVKGSGWDLATIEAEGFAPVKLKTLLQMAELAELSDLDMVKNQRLAMTNPSAPNPSVEAILHAIIPFTFVDHTHADAVVTITNTPGGEEKIRKIYGDNILIVPYVMPGFILAKEIFKMTQDIDWNKLEGMILLNHGVFTFHQEPKVSYERMIEIVSKAENYLKENDALPIKGIQGKMDPMVTTQIRRKISALCGKPMLAKTDNTPSTVAFSKLKNIKKLSTRGPITPDHIIRTKRNPVVINDDPDKAITAFARDYKKYFDKHQTGKQVMLDQAPRWAIVPGSGSIYFGPSIKSALIIKDIAQHTQKAIYQAEKIGGWKPLQQPELFEMEYWSLEQAKLSRAGNTKEMQGKIAIVTGAASGIGKACVERLLAQGAVVGALDIDPALNKLFPQPEVLSVKCDITKRKRIKKALRKVVNHFGGLDMVVSNAGTFPKSMEIKNIDEKIWKKSLAVNLSSHRKFLQACLPYLELGFDPAIVIIGSKNVPAPGKGAAAYSVAKAGLTQLARIASLELGNIGIRVNTIHPNAVYDTAIWTDEVLRTRAKHYGLTVEEYKTNNVLKVEVTSKDVAELVVHMLGKTFSKITGAQVPIDGGNERVI